MHVHIIQEIKYILEYKTTQVKRFLESTSRNWIEINSQTLFREIQILVDSKLYLNL